jgi:uncharacterized membrane protein
MTTVERSIVINASADAINAVTLDGSRLPDWYVGIDAATPDDVYPEPGGKVETTYKAAGMSFNLTMTATELVRGEYGAFKLDGMITGMNRWTYTPEGDGTRVTAVFEYEMPGGALGALANKLVVEKMNIQNLEKSLANLKALVEG